MKQLTVLQKLLLKLWVIVIFVGAIVNFVGAIVKSVLQRQEKHGIMKKTATRVG